MRRFFILIFALCFISTTGEAQSTCGIDLEAEINSLLRAQREADQGNDAVALSLLQSVQGALADISNQCINGNALLPNEYTSDDESLSFRYPSDWLVETLDGIYIIASDNRLLNLLENSDAPNLSTGDYFVAIFIEDNFGDSFREGVFRFQDDSNLGQAIDVPTQNLIGTTNAITASYVLEDSLAVSLAHLDFTNLDESPALLTVVAIGNPEELDVLGTFARMIASSVEYPPTSSLRLPSTPLTDLNYDLAISIRDLNDSIDPRLAVLSPDGEKIAYTRAEELCIYQIATGDIECYLLPNEGSVRVATLYWSPDSRYIAFHENFVRFFTDGDLYLYDDVEADIRVLTDSDDDVLNLTDGDREETIYLDGTVTWGADGQIYMLRTEIPAGASLSESPYRLMQVNPETGEITEIADFSSAIMPLSVIELFPVLEGIMATSPDMSQIAFVVYAPGADEQTNNGIWVYTFATDTLEHIATVDAFVEGLPNDYETQANRQIMSLGWDETGEGLYAYVGNFNYRNEPVMLYHINVNSLEVVPLIDFSEFAMEELPEEDENGFTLGYYFPDYPVVSPNGDAVIYLQSSFDGTISVVAVPVSNGVVGEAITLVEATEGIDILPSSTATMSRDGKILLRGILFIPSD